MCDAVGDHDAAAMESTAARAALDSLATAETERDGRAGHVEGLTQRELEILRLLARGKTNRGSRKRSSSAKRRSRAT